MKNIKLTIEYDGTNYNGWQRQTSHKSQVISHKLKTVQEEIERAILKITGSHSNVCGSGRTDSGVHAKRQTANFHTNTHLSIYKLKQALNAVLPNDISIVEAEEVSKGFHSRFDAKSKIYRYAILNRPARSPFLARHSLHIPYKLNLPLIKKEAKVLLGKHNFKSFQVSDIIEKEPVRTIKKITIRKNKNSVITIDIEADGFLYNMVRNIVGTLIEIGRGKFLEGSMKKILNVKDRKKAGPTVQAHGLCLLEVKY